MKKQDIKDVEVPVIDFPTIDGKLIESPSDNLSGQQGIDDAFDEEAAGDEEYIPPEKEIEEDEGPSPQKKVYVSSKKRSLDSTTSEKGENGETKNVKKAKN